MFPLLTAIVRSTPKRKWKCATIASVVALQEIKGLGHISLQMTGLAVDYYVRTLASTYVLFLHDALSYSTEHGHYNIMLSDMVHKKFCVLSILFRIFHPTQTLNSKPLCSSR